MSNPWAKKAAERAAIPSESEVTTAVRSAIAENAEADSLVEDMPMVEVIEPDDEGFTGYKKLSALIDHDFPFDESQLDAIDGLSTEQYACLTGAAGTGKTTTTKAVVDKLMTQIMLSSVDMSTYWKKGSETIPDPDDDYEIPEGKIPAVAMCAFTGRATQMIKKNFPRDWHGNIMTIHRMLGFVPEYYEDWDDETGTYKNKMRFTPTYNAMFKLPWDIIIIDEAGMLGLDLWHQLFDAMKDGCRIIMIGDINQLPPVHGKSVFGYAMSNWPSWELTHVHRQKGENNEIVDNAWRIINGQRPESGGRFQMIPLKGDAQLSSRQVRAMLPKMKEMGVYDPVRDVAITPINGEEGSRGFALGQLPLNRELALIFNPSSVHPRFIIDGGRERKQFAVGDKVMATKNDWEAGITNGMTGIITEIEANAEYSGDRRLFGTVEAVNEYLREHPDTAEYIDLDLDALDESMQAIERGKEKGKEKRDRGPSSHIITVRFGEGDHSFEIPFNTLAEVGSLMTAYVVTCHKMQGGECPVVVVILHESHRAMLYREWLYTAVTRASEKCIVLFKEDALRTALNKQKMPGKTLKQKIISFNEAQGITIDGVQMGKEVRLPHSQSTRNKILERVDEAVTTPARLTTQAELKGGLASLLKKKQERAEPRPEPEVTHKVEVKHTFTFKHVHESAPPPPPPTRREPVDGGDLTPERKTEAEIQPEALPTPTAPQLPPPPVAVSQPWAAHAWVQMRDRASEPRLLTYQPAEKPKNPWARKLA
jgi:ATP-dependent exoDNAse (exonuclease V) alpha subunit